MKSKEGFEERVKLSREACTRQARAEKALIGTKITTFQIIIHVSI
jgi:hypothetical protein